MSMDTPVSILLVDDDALIRAGLRAILASDPGISIIGEAENGARAIELAERLAPSVILMDIRMPQLDGLGALEAILAQAPEAKVLILTTFGEEDYIDRAMSGGACGFMLKSSGPEELLGAIHAVAEGAAALSPRIARRVIDKVRGIDTASLARARTLVQGLTVREREVLALVGSSLTNAEIAARLVLTEATVKGHMTAILLKLGARNRVDAALIAYRAGVVHP
ncbi:DNA-binding response regulator [Arthrobacter sp. MYb229]|uniref:response regulator n=1 Tax=unclassified Arthrobacter TaxID=235627 RepID=UPI000CFC6421|nr:MULTISPECIES: response regulator transcription factor [unclassified Arthrobacter]PQZ99165.1 DNA-binding response regulator [Arthrobacter sp. MYb229]PRB47550.1 DNA-binding response regulator [Arthrobacter sp. MYb216]